MKILMVCLGNICRSPMAQGILESKLKALNIDWTVDSAGTSGWHDGEAPDPRAINECRKHGLDISNQISRKVTIQDFESFDVIIAMDDNNKRNLLSLTNNKGLQSKIKLAIDYLPYTKFESIPDPYYDDRFDVVYGLLDEAFNKLISLESAIKMNAV